MTNVCIIGNLGGMGSRYTSILNYLGVECWGYDPTPPSDFVDQLEKTTHCIIASPTDTHISIINMIKILSPDMQILCEKPVTKNLNELKGINLTNTFMVNNYQYLPQALDQKYKGETSYNFYNSGRDGLAWDCIQLFKFDSNITLSNELPIWTVKINGQKVSKDQIDISYISMIKDFLNTRRHCWDHRIFWKLHTKVRDYALQNSYRDSSENGELPTAW